MDLAHHHSFGIAIDLNVELSDFWGGRWKHYDTMHFEYRPELLSPACRAAR